jgi:hypothetical protein
VNFVPYVMLGEASAHGGSVPRKNREPASLYLSGYIARAPNNRETLRSRRPYYYAWLGELFGVKK